MSDAERPRARVLVVDRSADLAEGLRTTLATARPEVVHLKNTTRLREAVTEDGPWDVVVAGPSEDSKSGLGRLVELRSYAPDVGLMLVLNGNEAKDLQALVKARPDELVELPLTRDALRTALVRTLTATATRRGRIVEDYGLPSQADPSLGKIYVVGGPTGGSGKTMVAISLAQLLLDAGAKRVVLVDLDVQFGEVTAALQLKPVHTMYDVLFDEQDRPYDETTVAETLAETLTLTETGIRVLPAPRDPVQGDNISAEEVGKTLRALRTQADYVVVDAATGLGELVLAALDHADHLLAVTQVDVPGVANLRTFLETVDQLGVTADRRSVVLNKEIPDSGVTGEDAAEVLGPVAGTIPFAAAVPKALNEGTSLVVTDKGHETVQRLVGAVSSLLPGGGQQLSKAPQAEGAERSGWRALLGGRGSMSRRKQ